MCPIVTPIVSGPAKVYKPFPFQAEGIAWLKGRSFALLADDMGLGKTNQAIFWASDNLPALIVVPAAVVWNWHKEITTMWRPGDTALVLDGKMAVPETLPQWTIVSYNGLEKYLPELKTSGFKSLVIDEAHNIKNLAAQRTKNIIELVEPSEQEQLRRADLQGDKEEVKYLQQRIPLLKPIKNRLAVTGTPVLNRPIELFALLRFLGVKKQEDYRDFMEKYTEHKNMRGRLIWTGAKNLDLLNKELQPFMLRRMKKDVLKDLPPKTNTAMFVPISNAKEYREAETNFLSWLEKTKGADAADRAVDAEVIVQMNSLRQLAAAGKVAPVNDWLKPCSMTGSKVLIFSSFTPPLVELHKLKSPLAVLYTGATSKEERQRIVDNFQKDPAACYFMGTIGAAGVGITLTAANRVCFLDLPWTPGGKVQAEDRAYRIGQKRPVEIVNVLAKGTIDERMLLLLKQKEEIIAQAVDGKSVDEATTGSIASNLLSSFMANPNLNDSIEQYVPGENDPDVDQISDDVLQGYLSDVDSIESLVASLFDSEYTWLAKRLNNCNLSERDIVQIYGFRPLRNFLAWATSRKEPVQACANGITHGVYQISVLGVKAGRDSDIEKHAKTVPGLKRVYSQDYNSVFEIVVPEETESKSLEWQPQEIHRSKEPVNQAAMFDSGTEIAKALGLKYDGIQVGFDDVPDSMQFTDLESGSTTYGNTLEEVTKKIKEMRKRFVKAKTSDMLRSDPVNGEVSSVDIPLTCGRHPVELHIKEAIENAEEVD